MLNQNEYAVSSLLNVVFRDYNTQEALAFFEEVKVANFSIAAHPVENSGGKGNLNLVAFNDRYETNLQMQLGTMSLWALGRLTNGIVSTVLKDRVHAMHRFVGLVTELPYEPKELTIYRLRHGGTAIEVVEEILDYRFLGLRGLQIMNAIGLDSETAFLVDYYFEADAMNVEVLHETPVGLYTIEANFELASRLDREKIQAYITIPKARIKNVFSLLLANLNNGNQEHVFEITAMRPDKKTGVVKIQLI